MHDDGFSIQDLVQPTEQLSEVSSTHGSETSSVPDDDITEFARCRVSRRPVMMIAFRKCNGEVVVLPYSMLRRIVSDDSDQQFSLQFTTEEIEVKGEKLTQLFHYLCEHRVMEIVEVSRLAIMSVSDRCGVQEMLIRRVS